MNYIFPLAFLVLVAQNANAMDDVTIAGTYTADRVMCKLYVDQALIDKALVNAIFRQDLSPSQAKLKAAQISVSIEGNVRDSGRVAEYCAGRTKK